MTSCTTRSMLGLCCGLAAALPAYVSLGSESDVSERKQMTTAAIAHAVEDELYMDEFVDFDDIRVSVRSGTARLEGSVPSLLAKDRATLIAETVKGVRSVENALDVEPKRELDIDELERRVRHAILTEPSTELFQINVTAIPPGEVTIEGAVDSLAEKEMVARVVRGVSGVTAVSNDIRVDYKAMRADREVELDIDALLRWDAYVDAGQVNVTVRDGVATLNGVVGSAAEKRRARSLALSTGVRDVNISDLDVSRWARDEDLKDSFDASDESVQQAVLRALTNSLEAPTELMVETDDGVVTLRGQVPSLGTKRAAEAAARSVAAVHTVRNRLRVVDQAVGFTPLTSNDIEQRIKDALVMNPATEAFDIEIDVRRGIATLTGLVDSVYERDEAGDIAAGIRGVAEVDNDLKVVNRRERVIYDVFVDGGSAAVDRERYDPGPITSRWRDSAIETEVRNQLWWSPFVNEADVNVAVEGGVVTLTGRVDSRIQREAARENALEGGAIRVVNKLDIESQ